MALQYWGELKNGAQYVSTHKLETASLETIEQHGSEALEGTMYLLLVSLLLQHKTVFPSIYFSMYCMS